MTSPTTNKGYTYPAHGGSVNAWDTPLNENFETIDLNLGGHWHATISSTIAAVTLYSSGATLPSTTPTLTIPTSLAANINYEFSGTLTANYSVVMPSEGGIYTVTNNLAGAFSLTFGTSTVPDSVTINTGGSNIIICDAEGISFANSNQGAAQLDSYLGDPDGNVDGVVSAVNGGVTDVLWDVTNRQLYIPTANSSTAWAPQLARLAPEGILTGSNSTSSPVMSADTTATTIYYTPYIGNWTILSTGTILFPYQFSQMSLVLTATQAASNIYDVFMWWNSGTPVIGTGPSWSAGTGGSVTAGTCARGTGAGGTALTRLQGVLVNAAQVTLTNNISTYVCPANEGIYLGSIFIDGTAGNVTCHRSWGASRKFGIWNYYNRQKVNIPFGISTASWDYAVATWRQSNADSTATASAFCGFAEEPVYVSWSQNIAGNASGSVFAYNTIAMNSITAPNSFTSNAPAYANSNLQITMSGRYQVAPFLGFNNFNWLENVSTTRNVTFKGTETNMVAVLEYRA